MVPEEAARQSRKLATQTAEMLERVAQSLVLMSVLPNVMTAVWSWMLNSVTAELPVYYHAAMFNRDTALLFLRQLGEIEYLT
jgi:hypothetical protein